MAPMLLLTIPKLMIQTNLYYLMFKNLIFKKIYILIIEWLSKLSDSNLLLLFNNFGILGWSVFEVQHIEVDDKQMSFYEFFL